MMMVLDCFKEFLSSLSRISQLTFQVWNVNGLVFSSQANGDNEFDLNKHRNFSTLIMNQTAYKCSLRHAGYSLFGTPIKYEQEVIGALIAFGSNSNAAPQLSDMQSIKIYRAEEIEAFLIQTAQFMEHVLNSRKEMEEMTESMAMCLENLSLYNRISKTMKTLKFSGSMLKALIEDFRETTGVDLAFIKIPRRDEFNVVVSTVECSRKIDHPECFVDSLINAIPQSPSSLEEEYFIVSDSSVTPEYAKLHPHPFRFLAVQVQHDGKFEGWLASVSFNLREIFRRTELSLLDSMAGQISILIANTDLIQDLERFVFNVVKSLVYTIEAKDIYTRGHSERVNRYCILVAQELGLDKKQKEILNWASILHDIGKIGIPEHILNKPGRLNEDEYHTIMQHPRKGYNILQPIEQLSSSLPAILHHHERYDGKGYPQGLKGQEIPFLARIIAVADTFDAITSSRAYRSAKPPQEALTVVEQVAGDQLDPYLVEIFKNVFESAIKPEYNKHHGE